MLKYAICSKENRDFPYGAVYIVVSEVNGIVSIENTNTGFRSAVNNFFFSEYFMHAELHSTIIEYEKFSKFRYFKNKYLDKYSYSTDKFHFDGNFYHRVGGAEVKFDSSRKQFSKLIQKVMVPYCQLYYQNMPLHFQVHNTVNSSLKLLETLFRELADDEKLTREVDRLVEFMNEVMEMNEEIVSESDKLILSDREKVIESALKAHKETLTKMIDTIKELNKHKASSK